jgi:hypothetical protein
MQTSGFCAPSEDQGNSGAHIALWNSYLAVASFLPPQSSRQTRPTLWHPDMSFPKVFVSENRITSLIDWEHAWIGPLFWQAQQARVVGGGYSERQLEYPEGYEDFDDKMKRAYKWKVEISRVLEQYEERTKAFNRDLYDVWNVPQAHLRRETIKHASDTWEADIMPFRLSLIRILW